MLKIFSHSHKQRLQRQQSSFSQFHVKLLLRTNIIKNKESL